MTPHALAVALRVPSPRIHEITRERWAITPDTALRLARYFGTTPEFWMELHSVYDLRRAEVITGESISREVTPRQVA